MSTTIQILNGNFTANTITANTQFTGSGAGLTNIPTTSITGTANTIASFNGSGQLSSTATVSTTNGGTGQNLSGVTGPAILTISSGAVGSTLTYGTNPGANEIVQRDANGYIPVGTELYLSVTGPAAGQITFVANNVQTTSNSSTTLITFPTPSSGTNGTAYTFNVTITLADTSGGVNTGMYWTFFKVKNIGGTGTVGPFLNELSSLDGGLSATSIAASFSSNTVSITGIGIAATHINWNTMLEVVSQNF
jgi:hypothetical protein